MAPTIGACSSGPIGRQRMEDRLTYGPGTYGPCVGSSYIDCGNVSVSR
jgi:hypothetical protein